MPTWNLSKKILFSSKELHWDQDKTPSAFHSTWDFKRSIPKCLSPYFLQIKCYKLLKWRFHRQFSRHFFGSCYAHSLVSASATYSQLPYCSCGWSYTADLGSLLWPRPRLNLLSLPWKFGFPLGSLPAWFSCAELHQNEGRGALRSQSCTWQGLHQHPPVPRDWLLNLQKHSHHIPQGSRRRHTWFYKAGKRTNLQE